METKKHVCDRRLINSGFVPHSFAVAMRERALQQYSAIHPVCHNVLLRLLLKVMMACLGIGKLQGDNSPDKPGLG